MSASCGHETNFDGVSADYKRRLWVVIAINAIMFAVEMTAGRLSQSKALQADALDFFADALTYALSLAVIGAPLATRANVAFFKGLSLLVMGAWILSTTLYQFYLLFSLSEVTLPQAQTMGLIGFLALLANLASVFILVRYKDGDANVRSVWLCSRNDAISNVAVMIAALGVWGTATSLPDLIVALIMASLFLSSSVQIIRQSLAERAHSRHQAQRGHER